MRSLVRRVSSSSHRAMKRLQPSPQWNNPQFMLSATETSGPASNTEGKLDFHHETAEPIGSDNATLNVSFHVFQTIDAPSLAGPVLRCMASCMCDEPASRHLAIRNGHHPKFLYPQWRSFLSPFMAQEGNYCVVAYDHGDEAVAAAFMYRDVCDELPEESKEALNHGLFRPFHDIMTNAKDKYSCLSKDTTPDNRGLCGELWMRATQRKYRHHGLSEELIGLTLKEMKHQGYEKAVIQSTGDFTKRAAEKNGFDVVVEIGYETFSFEGGFPFAGMEPPHTKYWVLEKDLS